MYYTLTGKQYSNLKSGRDLDLLFDKAQPIFFPADPEDHRLVVLISSATLVSVLLQVDTNFTESMTRCYNLSTYQSLVTITTKSKTNLDLKLDHRPIIGHQYVKVLLLLLTLVHLLAPASPSSLFHLSVGEIELAKLCGNIVRKDAISRNI